MRCVRQSELNSFVRSLPRSGNSHHAEISRHWVDGLWVNGGVGERFRVRRELVG